MSDPILGAVPIQFDAHQSGFAAAFDELIGLDHEWECPSTRIRLAREPPDRFGRNEDAAIINHVSVVGDERHVPGNELLAVVFSHGLGRHVVFLAARGSAATCESLSGT